MEKKFTVLRVIATLYKIAGVLVALATVLLVVIEIIAIGGGSSMMREFGYYDVYNGPIMAFIGVIFTFIGGGLSALGIYAIGEAFYLLINLEENTRFSAILLRDRFYAQPATPPVMPPQPPVANPPYNTPA